MCGEFIMLRTGVPNDFFLQNNCLQEQVEICLERPTCRKAKYFWTTIPFV